MKLRELAVPFLALLLLAAPARAQAPDSTQAAATPADSARTDSIPSRPWKLAMTAGLNVSQSAFSSNWAGGDRGSLVWVLGSNVTAERQMSAAWNFSNTLQLAYGQTARQQSDPADPRRAVWGGPNKTTDQIALESVSRLTLNAYVDPYLSLHMDSQFKDQSNPLGVIHWNPVKLKETAGIARVFEKTEDRETIARLGFGFRQTLASAFADTLGKTTRRFSSNDGGFEFQANATRPLLGKKVLYKGSLLVFEAVFYSKSSALERFDADARALDPTREEVATFWRAPDVNLQNTFTAQITSHLSVNLFAQWVYDKFDAAANVDEAQPIEVRIAEVNRNVRKAGQFKETLALGLTYTLF